MDFRDWIDLKTPQTLSVVLGVEVGAIRVWRHRRIIPRNVWPEIMERFPEVGLRDLTDMEAVVRPRVIE